MFVCTYYEHGRLENCRPALSHTHFTLAIPLVRTRMSRTAMDLDLIKVLWKDYGISLKWISTSTDGDISPESDYACHGSSLYISLRRVEAVSVSVRNLGIEVVRKPAVSRLWRQGGQSKADDEERASPKAKILDDVSADIPAGQIMAIIGSSGCGKVRCSSPDGRVC